MVAVAHPNLFAVASSPNTVKERAVGLHVNKGAAELSIDGVDDKAEMRATNVRFAICMATIAN